MSFRIQYRYITGDSFGSREKESILEYEWKTREAARQALNDIREHYKHYEIKEDNYGRYSYNDELKKRAEKILEDAPNQSWYVQDDRYGHGHHHIKLRMDDGQIVQFWAPWCGYFESLIGAEIVSEEDKFEVD